MIPALAIAMLVLLNVVTRLPIGGFYWDLALYVDASHRFTLGQWPHLDYFSQVGGLSLYLFHLGQLAFPHAQPVLIGQWSVFVVTAPLMWFVIRHVQARSRRVAYALVLPFLLFSTLPYNIGELFLSQSPDAFGIYNRQSGLCLYVLAAALFWAESRILQAVVCGTVLFCVSFIKISAAVPALAFVCYAGLAGRLSVGVVLAAIGGFLAAVIGLDVATGLVRGYLGDVIVLVRINDGGLVGGFVTMAARQFDTLLVILALGLVCSPYAVAAIRSKSSLLDAARAALASDTGYLFAFAALAVAYESQNTGSNEFIYLWPLLIRIAVTWRNLVRPRFGLVLGLTVAASFPSAIAVVQRFARATVAASISERLPTSGLGTIGRVTTSPTNLDRATFMHGHYAAFSVNYADLSAHGQMESVDLFTKADFQAFYLLSLDEAVKSVRTFEATRGVALASLFTLDFVDPLPSILRITPPRYVSLALDPRRTFPAVSPAAMREMSTIQAIMVPLCPLLPDRDSILAAYRPALAGRERVALSPCWDMYLQASPTAPKP